MSRKGVRRLPTVVTPGGARSRRRCRRPCGTPRLAIALTNPSRRNPSTASTPAWPSTARPHAVGRPTRTAAAPSAIAIKTSTPSRTPPSISTGTRPSTASTTSGSASSEAGRGRAGGRRGWTRRSRRRRARRRARASSARSTPLTTIGSSGACSRTQARSSHDRSRVELLRRAQRADRQVVAVARIAVTHPERRDVDGPHQRAVPRGSRASDELRRRARDRARCRAATTAPRHSRRRPRPGRARWRTHTSRSPSPRPRARRRELALVMDLPLERPGRHRHREREIGVPRIDRRRVRRPRAAEHGGPNRPSIERGFVGGEGPLGAGAARDVVEDAVGRARPRGSPPTRRS